MHEPKWVHKKYDWNVNVMNGRTLTDLMDLQPTDPAEVARYDVTVLVCMVNATEGSNKNSVFAPSSDRAPLA